MKIFLYFIDNYRDKEYDIFINMNKSSNPVNMMKEKFKTFVANNQKISDILFDKLSDSNDKIVKEVWEVLKLLPVNKNVRKRIEKNSFDGTEVYFKIFNFLHFVFLGKLNKTVGLLMLSKIFVLS